MTLQFERDSVQDLWSDFTIHTAMEKSITELELVLNSFLTEEPIPKRKVQCEKSFFIDLTFQK
jgi:hypothetical protein